jgi:hypothetical protein
MRFYSLMTCTLALACLLAADLSHAADQYGLTEGNPGLKSAGPMTFGPDGILFIADTKAGEIVAVATGDKQGDASKASINIEGLNVKLAELLKADSGALEVTEVTVNPASGNVYLAVNRGNGGPALVRVNSQGQLELVALDKVPFAKSKLPSPPPDAETGEGRRRRNRRSDAVTDLAFFEGRLIVSGQTAEEPGSAVTSITFPFSEFSPPAALEIYHGAHGAVEAGSAPRAFVPFTIDGEPHLLAGYQCTPLVKFPLSDLKAGEKVRGTTVAELGNRNRPLDMVAYEQGGKDYLLMANSARGVMKISTDDIAREEGITERVEGETAGQKYETISALEGTVQLDRVGDAQVVVLIQPEGGPMTLKTVELP